VRFFFSLPTQEQKTLPLLFAFERNLFPLIAFSRLFGRQPFDDSVFLKTVKSIHAYCLGKVAAMQRRFDLITFDLDGTLIDNRVAIRQNLNYALELHGFPQLKDQEIDAMVGTPLAEIFEKILPESSRHLVPQLVDAYVRRYLKTSHVGAVALEGVIPTLDQLRKEGFKLAVATTKRDDTVAPLLQKIGLLQYFDLVTGRMEGMRNKPNPDMLRYVMKKLNVTPQRTAMVGDTPIDIKTARNAGVYAIAVTSSIQLGMTTLDRICDANPDRIIGSLRELPDLLHIR
jgi:HAD superfamily hydrolase (TIGR01509 family)